MKLILNADDFGYSKGVNYGVIEASQNGIVQSSTIMAGMPGFDHAVLLAHENPNLRIGVHLMLTTGKSIIKTHKTITDEHSNFFHPNELFAKLKNNEIDLKEVEDEFEAQIQKVFAAGIVPDHFDSHHFIHTSQSIIMVFLRLAQKYNVKVRLGKQSIPPDSNLDIKTTEVFSSEFYDENANIDYLLKILKTNIAKHTESLEVMCHPAYIDFTLLNTSTYNINRAYEVNILTSKELKSFINDNKIEICSFEEI
ncbi:chitin disaccharide deacetylase [Anaerocolumna jejuensis]|uniref:chitin disaccharide deacetylase n=1 Tax=Anaerocolumna jejuensis TaxID=259063 RepID=UPI003F7C1A62